MPASTPPLHLFCPERFQPVDVIHVPLLYPWKGVPGFESKENLPGHRNRFDAYQAEAESLFTLVEAPEQADAILFPANLNFCHHASAQACFREFLDCVESSAKPGLVFAEGDLPEDFQHPHVHFFHSSIYRELNGPLGHARPPFLADPANDIALRPPPETDCPHVSFRGVAPPWDASGIKRLRESLRYALFRLGLLRPVQWGYAPRAQAVHVLRNETLSGKANPVLAYDEHLLGCTPLNWSCGFFKSADSHGEPFDRIRQLYLESILDNHYILCARGQGNYSLRFYETLALGRIPVYIDTAPLPFEARIDWDQHLVRVPARNIATLGQRILTHWREHREHLADLATTNRQLYLDRLTPEGFFRQLSQHFLP